MQMPGRTTREILRLPGRVDGAAPAPWAVFDPVWYRLTYPDAPGATAEDLLEWHLMHGQALGHSPNRYFDEMWQRRAWSGIQALIEAGSVTSAFEAWCGGPHATRAPHWLFDPREYRTRYPALTDEVLAENGFINRYDHYLSCGAAEGRIGHALFDPAIYLEALDPTEREGATPMPFWHYLRGLEAGAPERKTSILFDQDWYRERYPEAARAVLDGQYRSLLAHYLCNDRPTEFDPSPWFSESYYLTTNPGLAEAIGGDGFRNGFVHYLAHGSREARSPHPDLDIAWYADLDDVQADIQAERASDAFTHWITIGHPAGRPGRQPRKINVTEAHGIELYQRRAETIWTLYSRHKLDFSHGENPTVSVIMRGHDQGAETMVCLTSLRTHYSGEIELILIASGTCDSIADIESQVSSAKILRFTTALDEEASRQAGLICATAHYVLLLAEGIELAPGAIDAAIARLASDPAIGAVGGRLIQPHGLLHEAGGIIWRDGQLSSYLHDAPALTAEGNFVRDTDFCSTLCLLARREVLASLPHPSEGVAGTTHDAADLCVRIREAGFRVVYDPDVLAFITNRSTERRPDGCNAFVAAHADFLSGRPPLDPTAIIHARSPAPGALRVLFIEDSIPLRHIGSGFVRSNDVIRVMAASGASVTVFPMKQNSFSLPAIRSELPDTVEAMHDLSSADFADFVSARKDYYDLIWIARTHNLDRMFEHLAADATIQAGPAEEVEPPRHDQPPPLFNEAISLDPALLQEFARFDGPPEVSPGKVEIALARPKAVSLFERALGGKDSAPPRVIVDTEAVASVRRAGQAAMHGETFDLDASLHQEFCHLDPTMNVVAVNASEAAIIRRYHDGPVTILGHGIAPSPTSRSFEERTGLLFVGAIHGMEHPNYDGLAWFIDEVLPLIERTLRWETRLTVAGYVAPGVSLDRFKGHARVTLRGAVTDLAPLYDANRVFIAPTRFAAGIPYKVHEAAAFGLPVVATSLLAHQLGWRDAEAIGAADVTDPAGFAARVIALHRDVTLWTRIREGALARVAEELAPAGFAEQVGELLQPVIVVEQTTDDCNLK